MMLSQDPNEPIIKKMMQMNEGIINRRQMAKLAGWSLIAMAIVAGIGYGYAFGAIYVKGDSAATLGNIQQQRAMLPIVITTYSIMLLLDVVVAWALYKFFLQDNPALSRIAGWLRVVYCVWLAVAILQLYYAQDLSAMKGADAGVVMNYIERFLQVWSQGLIVFGVHLLLIGTLACRTAAIPKLISGLVFFAGVAYMGTNILRQIWDGYMQYKATVEAVLSLPMALGELLLAVWLIRKVGK